MAISITNSPTATKSGQTLRTVSAENNIFFEFTAGASETSLQVALYEADGTTQIAEYKAQPFPSSGVVEVDLKPLISSQFSTANNSITSASTALTPAPTQFLEFRVGYREVGNSYTVDADLWYGVRAVQQLLDADAPNMAAYVTTYSGSPLDVDQTGLFLTGFDETVFFYYDDDGTKKGFFPTLAFLTGEGRETDEFSISGLGTKILSNSGADTSLYYFTPNTDFTFPDSLTFSAVNETIGASAEMIRKGGTSKEVCDAGASTPTIVKWRNEFGGWDVWVFEGRKPRGIDVTATGRFARPTGDIATQQGFAGDVLRRGEPSITVSADQLTLNQAEELEKIAFSPKVLIFVGNLTDTNYDKWLEVTVSDSFQSYDEYDPLHSIEYDFVLPKRFAISN